MKGILTIVLICTTFCMCNGQKEISVVVDERVLHDRVQPCLEVGVVLELVPEGERPQHGVLDEVHRIFPVLGQAQGEVVKRLSQADELLFELEGRHVVQTYVSKTEQREEKLSKQLS